MKFRLMILLAGILVASTVLAVPDDFIRGDFDNNGGVNIADAIGILGFLFAGGSPPCCPDAADANDDGLIGIADTIYLLDFLFPRPGPPPPAPFPACGADPTLDSLPGCVELVQCVPFCPQ